MMPFYGAFVNKRIMRYNPPNNNLNYCNSWIANTMSKSLLRSTSLVSFMTFQSRILGFVRDMVIAHMFGASAGMDAFLVAFKIPNFMRALFAEGSFSQAFVPVISEYKEKRRFDEVQTFVRDIAGTLGVALFFVTLLAMVTTPWIVKLFAPGFTVGEMRFTLATDMLRVTFPYLMLISLTAMGGAVLNSYSKFGVAAFTPVLLNVCLIAAALWLSPFFAIPIKALAWGVFIAGVVQLLFQLPFLHKLGFLQWPRFNWRDEGVKRVLKLMLPALFGVTVGQINLLVNTIFASFLQVGSVSWLYYSDRLSSFPLGVFGVALGTVVLPYLSRKHATQAPEDFARAMDWGLRCVFIIGLPAMLGLAILAGPLLTTLFQYGRFNAHDVIMSQQSLLAFAFGVQAFMLVKVLAPGFYARQNIRTPVKIGIIAMVSNIILNALLVWPLAHAGLALGTTLAAWINAILLYIGLHKSGVYRISSAWWGFAARLLLANGIMSLWLIWACAPLAQWLQWHGLQRATHLLILLGGAVMSYLLCLTLTGVRWHHFRLHDV